MRNYKVELVVRGGEAAFSDLGKDIVAAINVTADSEIDARRRAFEIVWSEGLLVSFVSEVKERS